MDDFPLSAVLRSTRLSGPSLPVEMLEVNRRRHPRYPCEGSAEVFVPQGALLFKGKILDLSLSGCFIETPVLNLERGTHVEVSFTAHRMQFRLAGHIVVLYRKRGAGIAFHNVSERRARQISDLLRELKEVADAGAAAVTDDAQA